MTSIERHQITGAELQQLFGNRVRPAPSACQLEAVAHKFNSGIRWPGDPPPSPGEPGYVELIDDDDDDDNWREIEDGLKAAKTLLRKLPALSVRSNIWTPESVDRLKASLERTLFPFGECERTAARVHSSKEWQCYAHILAVLIIRELVNAGNPQPAISRNSAVVRVILEVMIRKQLPDVNMVTTSAIARFLERWDNDYGLTPRSIARLTTAASRRICGFIRGWGLCHLSESEFALRIGPHHEDEGCKSCQPGPHFQQGANTNFNIA